MTGRFELQEGDGIPVRYFVKTEPAESDQPVDQRREVEPWKRHQRRQVYPARAHRADPAPGRIAANRGKEGRIDRDDDDRVMNIEATLSDLHFAGEALAQS